MAKKIALITGISGQDGSYLAEFLLAKGYQVHGLVRRLALEDGGVRLSRLKGILPKIKIHHGDVSNYQTIWRLIAKLKPDEVYHLAAQSFVWVSFLDDFATLDTNISGTHHVLSAIKETSPKSKFYFAGSSEMFGQADHSPQNEKTKFNPVSPYAISKVAGHHLTTMYREAYSTFACSGILFNHESPRRGFEFVTRKITSTAAKIKVGLASELELGNLDAKRDWGFAGDYVPAMWQMLQQKEPDDYIIATGENHSVREFTEVAFDHLGLDWKKYVKVNSNLERPAEVHHLKGNSSKANKKFGWKPKVKFVELVKMMVDADLKLASQTKNGLGNSKERQQTLTVHLRRLGETHQLQNRRRHV